MGKTRVLIVDDDASGRRWLGKLLLKEGYEVDVAADGAEALGLVAERAPAVIVADLNMPRMNGLELLKRVRQSNPEIGMILVTAQDKVAVAVEAMRAGAQDYLTKPLEFDALRLSVERTLAYQALVSEAASLRQQLHTKDGSRLGELVGSSAVMQRVFRTTHRVAASRASVLLLGEVGTGKRLLAKTIHELSGRSGPLVKVHASAFDGASFARAAEGTLLLTDVADITPASQLELFELLSDPARRTRVISTATAPLASAVADGEFRDDLHYLLSVVPIELPPLRLRGADVLLLAEHFMLELAREQQRDIAGLSDEARRKVISHHWPGNLPELRNALQRAVLFSEGGMVDAAALPFEAVPSTFDGIRVPGATLAEVEKYVIMKTFEAAEGSTARTAEILDVSLRTIQYRLAEYGVPTRRARTGGTE